MPYWSLYCIYCLGYIAAALLECVPVARRSNAAFRLLFGARPGGALACPYCNALLGFDDAGCLREPLTGWPVFRYGRAELEIKREADGEPADIRLAEWAIRHRFTRPGTHAPLRGYVYAEDVAADETVR